MLPDSPLPFIFNSFALALSMSFLLIVLWYDARRRVTQFFALFLVLVAIWNVGSLLEQLFALELLPIAESALRWANAAVIAGYTGSSISLYALMTILIGLQPRRFRLLTTLYLLIAFGYTVFIALQPQGNDLNFDNTRSFAIFFSVIFDSLTIYVIWRYRRKLRNLALTTGVVIFVIGQAISLLNPQLRLVPLASSVGSLGAMIISFAIIQREIISPLLERGNQLESMHEVSIAITSRISTDAVLTEIAERAAAWLEADATGIFLANGNQLELVALHNLPSVWQGATIQAGEGVAGIVAETRESIYLENYSRDWHGMPDLPLASESFGSTIGVPLIYDDTVMGTLLVVAGVHGHLLDKGDMRLLELLAAQAAVAISNGTLFSNQKRLTLELENANIQLKTVLVSTESPVIAVNRKLHLIFANPAAQDLFAIDDSQTGQPITDLLPSYTLPDGYRIVLRDIKQHRVHIYEVTINDKTYFCHLASLGNQRIEGWVAVLNDVTELKELDRIKSEMVRMTSHDLKNPLQAAMANLELLRDDLESIENGEIALSVDNIEKQLFKMMRIISGILDLERVRLGATPTEVCDPQQIVNDALSELTDMALDKDVRLIQNVAIDIAPFLGDYKQFARAIVNLIENAIKFNREGGEVNVSVKNVRDQIQFTIRDDGIGIPDHLQPHIFERFYRGHQPGAEHISGSGLGLSLVKAVVESHNGQIWVESKNNQGTTFFITIPALAQHMASSTS